MMWRIPSWGVSMQLLTSNTKLSKTAGDNRYSILGLALPPAKLSGRNLCPEHGDCANVCNGWFSGRTVTEPVRNAMLARSALYLHNRALFMELLSQDIERHLTRSVKKGRIPLTRLNIASDLNWCGVARSYAPHVFYDYTKVRKRIRRVLAGDWPENYELTYSISEKSDMRLAGDYLRAGHNVSIVLDAEYNPQHHRYGEIPDEIQIGRSWYPVIDGDLHDRRIHECDGEGKIIALRFKGGRSRLQDSIDAGFVWRIY
jgi:hypothetical protein